jgi:glutathione-regulated potassium-efflux system protein KefB
VTAAVLAAIGIALGLPFAQALFIGLALSLSSTAFALQVLEEKGELTTRHGRLAFSVLLFQDLAAIPLIALVPLFAFGAEEPSMDLTKALIAIGTILGVIVGGRFLLSRLYRIVAATGVREAMTASALLTVVGVALAMEAAGLSAALGAFIAGALLADSEYRHQIEADIAPFEGLLLAVFFIAVGMSIDLGVLVGQPVKLAALVVGFVALKAAILYLLGRWWGLDGAAARRLGLVISQGGDAASPPHRRRHQPGGEAGAAGIRDAAGWRSACHCRGLRPVWADRGPRAPRPPHPVHGARLQYRAGRFREALRRANLLWGCGAHRHPSCRRRR